MNPQSTGPQALLKIVRAVTLTALLCLPACAQGLRQQMDQQQADIGRLQQETQTLSAYRADTSNELDKIKQEIQSIKGLIEENVYMNRKNQAALEAGLESALADLKRQQSAVAQLKRQLSPAASSPPYASPPVETVSDQPASGIEALYNEAHSYFKKSDYEKARKLFKQFARQHPESDLADNALYWIGNSYFKEKEYEKAIATLDDAIKKYPKGNKVPDAYYLQALCFCEINDPLTAQILLESLIQNFPNAPATASGKKKYEELKAKPAS